MVHLVLDLPNQCHTVTSFLSYPKLSFNGARLPPTQLHHGTSEKDPTLTQSMITLPLHSFLHPTFPVQTSFLTCPSSFKYLYLEHKRQQQVRRMESQTGATSQKSRKRQVFKVGRPNGLGSIS